MPRGDRRGPEGLGPRSGRGLGYCSGYDRPGYMQAAPGRGLGRGYGLGRGCAYGYGRGFAYYSPVYEQELRSNGELEDLKYLEKNMNKELDLIKKRINELENKEKSEE